jgi:hypothetical protein
MADRDAKGLFQPGNHISPGRAPRAAEIRYLEAAARGCPPEDMAAITARMKSIALGEVKEATVGDQVRAGSALARILVPAPSNGPGEQQPARVDWNKLSLEDLQALLALYGKAKVTDGVVDVGAPHHGNR